MYFLFFLSLVHKLILGIAVVIFVPSNETQKNIFEGYIEYFRSKERAGVVPMKKLHLYLLPPCPDAFKIHKFDEGQLLGVFMEESANLQPLCNNHH